MSYKKDLQVATTSEYDFIDICGPSTYREIDTLFTEYCKEASTTLATEDGISLKADDKPKLSSFNPAKTQRSDRDSPVGKKSSLASIISADKKFGIEPSSHNPRHVRISESISTKAEESKAIAPKHVKIDSLQMAAAEKDIMQLAKEFDIPLAALANMNTPEEKERYVIEAIRNHFNEEFKEFSKKHAAKMNQSKKFERDFQKKKDAAKGNKADIFKWLQVRTPFEPLKKKLRARIIETIHEVQNNEIKPSKEEEKSVRLDYSVDEKSKSRDGINLNTSRMVTLEHVPAINNSELLGGLLEDDPHGILKITKRMKSARGRDTAASAKLQTSRFGLNASQISSRVNPTSPGLSTTQIINQKAQLLNQKVNNTEGDNQNQNEANESYSWNPTRENIFSYSRADAKNRLFNTKDVKSPSWNELGFSPLIQAFMMIEKSKSERDAKLAQYMNGDLLTAEEYKFLANTSVSLNSCVDKKFLQKVVNGMDPEVIHALELDLAESILKEYQKVRREIKEARQEYLKADTERCIAQVNKNDEKYYNRLMIERNRHELQKTKQRIVNFLKKEEEKKGWKRPRTQDTINRNKTEDENAIVKLFSEKLLHVVGHNEAPPKIQNLNFLRAFVHTPNYGKEIDVKLSKHHYHPSSKIILRSNPQQQKDFMGLGTSYTNQKLKKTTNENIEDYKLNIHCPPELRGKGTFRKYYTGGPTGEDQNIFQGNYLFGDITQYKVTPYHVRVVTKIQAVWRGYRQRQLYGELVMKKRERERYQKKLEALKQNTTSRFVHTILQTKDAKFVSINPKVVIANRESGVKTSQNLKTDRSLAQSRVSTLADLDRKYVSIHDAQRIGDGQPLPNIRESPYSAQHNNNIDILINEDGNLKSSNKPLITPIIKKNGNFSFGDKKNLNINLGEAMQEVNFSAIQPKTTDGVVGSHRSQKAGTGDTLSTITAEESSPTRKRIRTIAARAPPKGLLLKQRKLFVAAKSNNLQMILNSGFNYFETDVNAKDDQGNTPLFYAAKNGSRDICEFLLKHGAKVNEPCSDNNTPLHMGFSSNQVMLVIVLISRGGNLNILNDHGQTPIAFGSESLLKLLNLKDAVATYEGDGSRALPSGHDNNQYLIKLNNNRPPQDAISFKYQPLAKSTAKVADADHNLYSFMPPKERVKSAVRRAK